MALEERRLVERAGEAGWLRRTRLPTGRVPAGRGHWAERPGPAPRPRPASAAASTSARLGVAAPRLALGGSGLRRAGWPVAAGGGTGSQRIHWRSGGHGSAGGPRAAT